MNYTPEQVRALPQKQHPALGYVLQYDKDGYLAVVKDSVLGECVCRVSNSGCYTHMSGLPSSVFVPTYLAAQKRAREHREREAACASASFWQRLAAMFKRDE